MGKIYQFGSTHVGISAQKTLIIGVGKLLKCKKRKLPETASRRTVSTNYFLTDFA